jgi:D-3-phosphoglycerate dehydrogenase / 2-oxoglutarate reductase
LTPVRIVRFNHWISPEFGIRLAREKDVSLIEINLKGEEQAAWAELAQAHIYQITAAVNELPPQYRITSQFLQRCPALMCVSSGGAGHDTVDVEACTKAGVAVVNQIGGNAGAVAEMAIGLMLALSRRIVESDRKLRTVRPFTRESVMGHDIGGKTLGIVGIGHAGTRTALLAKAFGMRVLAVDPNLSPETIVARGAEPVNLDGLVAQADIVSLHCPSDASTINLFDAKRFASMKKGALFISTARGGIHDEKALFNALQTGHLSGAGLDVWEIEPPPLNHPLLTLTNVVATHHTAGVSHEGRANVAMMAAEQIVGLIRGIKPPRLVNPEVWDAFSTRHSRTLKVLT